MGKAAKAGVAARVKWKEAVKPEFEHSIHCSFYTTLEHTLSAGCCAKCKGEKINQAHLEGPAGLQKVQSYCSTRDTAIASCWLNPCSALSMV